MGCQTRLQIASARSHVFTHIENYLRIFLTRIHKFAIFPHGKEKIGYPYEGPTLTIDEDIKEDIALLADDCSSIRSRIGCFSSPRDAGR